LAREPEREAGVIGSGYTVWGVCILINNTAIGICCGDGEPSLAILRKLSKGLNVAADELLFEEGEREPKDDLKLMFEAIGEFDDKDVASAKELLQALIIKASTKKWAT